MITIGQNRAQLYAPHRLGFKAKMVISDSDKAALNKEIIDRQNEPITTTAITAENIANAKPTHPFSANADPIGKFVTQFETTTAKIPGELHVKYKAGHHPLTFNIVEPDCELKPLKDLKGDDITLGKPLLNRPGIATKKLVTNIAEKADLVFPEPWEDLAASFERKK